MVLSLEIDNILKEYVDREEIRRMVVKEISDKIYNTRNRNFQVTIEYRIELEKGICAVLIKHKLFQPIIVDQIMKVL